jgi:catechol 2,3-dioxygenase-like lactoylglutathione lyase family enzyme
MKLNKVYHMGIPVDDLDRAKDFYTQVLGMEYLGRVGGNPNNPDSFPVHGVAQKLDRFRCGDYDIVLFARPRPLNRDAVDQDGIAHQAFSVAWEDYDAALTQAKELGKFHRLVERDSGKQSKNEKITYHEGAKSTQCGNLFHILRVLRGLLVNSRSTQQNKSAGTQHGQTAQTLHRRNFETRRYR